jgi:hypothetical protein
MTTRGIARIQAARRIPFARSALMFGGVTRCMETYGNGVQIGIIKTLIVDVQPVPEAAVSPGQHRQMLGCFQSLIQPVQV